MKPKHVFVLVLILAVLSAATVMTLRMRESAPGGDEKVSGRLFKGVPWQDVKVLALRGPDGAVTLAERDGRWVVEERGGYPADFEKIARLGNDLREAQIGRSFEADEESLARLGLKEPGEASVRSSEEAEMLQLKNGQGQELAAIALGKPYPPGGNASEGAGQYVRVKGDPAVYVVDRRFFAGQTPADWLDKQILNVNSAEIAEITCRSDDGRRVVYRLTRRERGADFELAEPKADLPLSGQKAGRLASALSSLQMLDLAEPFERGGTGKEDAEFPVRIDYRLFSGLVYTLYPGTECHGDQGCPLRVEAAYEPRETAAPGGGEPEAENTGDGSGEDAGQEPAGQADLEAARLEGWVFLVPEWKHGALFVQLDDLLEKPDGPSADKGE